MRRIWINAATKHCCPRILSRVRTYRRHRARKPVETWSAVVICDDPSISGKQITERVLKEVARELVVSVHEVRELMRGGAVIRTPSVFGVDTGILTEEFMEVLYAHNFKEEFSPAAFRKAVHLETKPWSITDGERANLTLEVDEKALNVLEQTGRIYIKRFSYRCRSLVHTYSCHRCLEFAHKVSQCRVKETICRQRGQAGHTAPRCKNPVDCLNCRFKGFPSRHSMLSDT
ncbi:GM18776 [Drosophila sechellia]|uniref:GM18776 n=1 Tax=Drosophila sechellia TaxID=7238 RepID=B4IM68_DROSE|nr:GM18776 [Drosophila sechellia]